MVTPDAVTRRWIRNASDEQAAANGCRVEEERGQHVLDFARKYLKLYEGDWAGQPLEPMLHQIDLTMRLFAWIKWSDRWKRWVRRFRQASIFIPKKNAKSPTLAWWGLYLLCGDGEQGQKVYLGAKDGMQSREIAGKHAIEMVQSSPDLMAECTINRSLMQITHEPTRSIMKPISSGDSRAQKSKEGLNGCILIDETHVVDREFMGRVSRAGISRSEPLQIEVSTAGDDPEGYGKERYDYGKLVEKEGGNEAFFFADYSAPQDLKDEDLAADPVKWGRAANPAWGQTIDPEEFLADYRSSVRSLVEFGRFKMYRLNIWQRASSPWLRAGDWDRCRRSYAAEDLRGRPCWAGLDLSKTRDLTALALCFPWEEDYYRLLLHFWMPEQSARERADRAPFLQWAADGWITLTPGGTVDYGSVRKHFREAAAMFDIRELAYDPWNAEETTQALSEGVIEGGKVIEEGTGVTRVLFKQSMANFAGPSEEFEKLVIEGKLNHNSNPVLDWQAGHVAVIRDSNDNRRPVKPNWPRKTEEVRTIDGIVGAVQALGRALQRTDTTPSITWL